MAKREYFSLIELVVFIVIAVAILLAALMYVDDVRAYLRDRARIADIRQIAIHLEQYRGNVTRYPIVSNRIQITGEDDLSHLIRREILVDQLPIDPLYPDYAYLYDSEANGRGYTLTFCLETNAMRGYTKGCGNQVHRTILSD